MTSQMTLDTSFNNIKKSHPWKVSLCSWE